MGLYTWYLVPCNEHYLHPLRFLRVEHDPEVVGNPNTSRTAADAWMQLQRRLGDSLGCLNHGAVVRRVTVLSPRSPPAGTLFDCCHAVPLCLHQLCLVTLCPAPHCFAHLAWLLVWLSCFPRRVAIIIKLLTSKALVGPPWAIEGTSSAYIVNSTTHCDVDRPPIPAIRTKKLLGSEDNHFARLLNQLARLPLFHAAAFLLKA
jgi:hypothetical protein